MSSNNVVKFSMQTNGSKYNHAIKYNLGNNLEEAVQLFGAEVVHKLFMHKAAQECRTLAKRMLASGKTMEEVMKTLKGWKPGEVKRLEKDPYSKLLANYDKADTTTREAMIDRLKEFISSTTGAPKL